MSRIYHPCFVLKHLTDEQIAMRSKQYYEACGYGNVFSPFIYGDYHKTKLDADKAVALTLKRNPQLRLFHMEWHMV